VTETTTTLAIPVAAAEVWDALADFGEIARWAPNVDHSCLLSPQTEGVGTVRRIQAGRRTLVERVVEWQPGERLGYDIEGLPAMVRSLQSTWHLDERGPRTVVSLTTAIDAGSRPPQKLIAKALIRQLSKVSYQMLDGLDLHVRGSTP